MNEIFFTGLTSGVDWKSIVDKLMEVKSQQLNNIKIKNNIKSYEKSFWNDLILKLNNFLGSIEKIRRIGGNIFNEKDVVLSNNNIINANIIDKNITNISYNINIKSVAYSAYVSGRKLYTGIDSVALPAIIKSEEKINNGSDRILASEIISNQLSFFEIQPEQNGEIEINNKRIQWNIYESINDIISKINSSDAKVTATFDYQEQKINILSNNIGSKASVVISDVSGNFTDVFKIYNKNATGTDAKKTDINAKLNEIENIDINISPGYFTINGIKIFVDIQNDSISSIISKINNSSAGVIAIYDSFNNSIVLTQKSSGVNNKIILGASDDTSNFLYAIKLSENHIPVGGIEDTYLGEDAVLSINNSPDLRFDSNNIKYNGININILNTGNVKINVVNNNNKIISAIKDFVSNFNDIILNINKKLNEEKAINFSKSDDLFNGRFRGNSTLISLKDTLINLIINSYSVNDSNYKMAEELGIKIEFKNNYKDIEIIFNENEFLNKLENNFNSVSNFFVNSGGFIESIYSTISNYISYTGPIYSEIKEDELIIKQNDIRINEIKERLEKERQLLTKQFIEMESAMAMMQSQLTKLFNLKNNE